MFSAVFSEGGKIITMQKKNRWLLISIILVTMLALAACAGGEAPAEDAGGGEDTAAEADSGGGDEAEDTAAEADSGGEEAAPAAGDEPGTFLARAQEGEFDGTEVNVFGAIVDVDQERFEASMIPFEEATGIDVVYEGSGDFESLITVRVEGGDPPDVAAFPQPGLMADLASRGALIDLGGVLDVDQLEQDYIPAWINLGTVNDQLVGIFYRANLKSLVWYPIPEFEEAGYEVPETWDEMMALADQMVADGNAPWCIGIESSGATGWVATDWVEDIMLRTAGPEVYDQWVRHEIPFNDPAVKNAVEIMGEIWLNPDYVLGGTTAILTVPFGDAQTPMFDDPPGCWLHRQASFIPAFFPKEGEEVGTETWFFYLPPIDEAQGKPVLGAGDAFSMFNDRPEVRFYGIHGHC
jgi:alpha-glucoside transport system substrate-binding protein